jgi:general stress protein YciG
MEEKGKSKRGLATLDPAKRREIQSLGGRAAHRLGKAHKFTPEEAREAGKKGGRTTSRDRAHMIEIGRKGREKSAKSRKARASTKNQPGQKS